MKSKGVKNNRNEEECKVLSDDDESGVKSDSSSESTTTMSNDDGDGISPDCDGGRPVQIISIGSESDRYAFSFHEERLDSVLQKIPSGRKVCVVSVVGAFRTGKSFLLSWFLRYLHFHSSSHSPAPKHTNKNNDNSQLPKVELDQKWYEQFESLGSDGFEWRGGSERHTTGISIWSHPHFLSRTTTGHRGTPEDLAVLLVDTQGMFDHETTMGVTAAIFGLSTLLSSYQIHNVDKRIQEDHLQQLALFSEYGRMALQEDLDASADNVSLDDDIIHADAPKHTKQQPPSPAHVIHKPFQHIEFLVRDWQHFEDDQNLDRCEREMESYFQSVIAERDATDLKDTREQITACFDKINCFMLTHPGFAVTRNNYSGSVRLVEPTFLAFLDRYCSRVFLNGGLNLLPKTIHGRELTAVELGAYMKAYAKLFESGANFPEAATMLEATASTNNHNATNRTVEKYKKEMDQLAGPRCSDYMPPMVLEESHWSLLKECEEMFHGMANFGNRKGIEKARLRMLKEIEDQFEVYAKLNASRNPLAGFEIYVLPMSIAFVSLVLRWVADSTCSSWSSTCRASSDVLSHVYQVVSFFLVITIATKAKKVSEAYGRFKKALDVVLMNTNDNNKQRQHAPHTHASKGNTRT